MKVDAMVLAGSRNIGKLQAVSDQEYEALIPVANRPMFTYVLDALRQSEVIERIVVVGPKALKSYLKSDEELVESAESLSQNIQRGINKLEEQRKVLIVTSDIPFIHKEAIEDFLKRCQGLDGDLFYPVVSRQANEKSFQGVERTYVQLKDGVFTGGNITLVSPKVIKRSEALINKTVSMRKKPWQLSRMLGFLFIIKFLLHKLTISEIEERVHDILGVKGVAVVSPYPEIGVDVDKPSDWHLAERVLSNNNPPHKEESHA